ncbi:hypothetical protein BX281_0095 [Streptomyces sp. Ag82_O1-15]|uniref:hypothetical protein n=1 Tax=Streptomyces sp. Ag82_O1-15 TaxID=1938855 RepID=UPI000BD7EFCC|nr:hypothetical protein [Streptomyces sp. Ag82_O1-15]PBC92444.1 hypothetical protein BX281_0095 [Streptomyces sp. Ag82_O1-15]
MLLQLRYLAVPSVFAFIRLLPMSAADKDIETLTPRHQLAVCSGRSTGHASPCGIWGHTYELRAATDSGLAVVTP